MNGIVQEIYNFSQDWLLFKKYLVLINSDGYLKNIQF